MTALTILQSFDQHAAHVAKLTSEIADLTRQRALAEEQLVRELADGYQAGTLTAQEIYALYQQYKPVATEGFSNRWHLAMPAELTGDRIRWTAVVYVPDPDGNWRGEMPIERETRTPAPGTSVVYVLFDAENQPCYVGSTEKFRTRIRKHETDGKPFVRWLAYPCRDRSHAYRLEEKLLSEHQPYLNRKACR